MDELLGQVFRRVETANQSHDTHVFNVLMAVDGERSVGAIAKEGYYELEDLAKVIKALVENGAIEPVLLSESQLNRKTFFSHLKAQLSIIMGPVSELIIQDFASEVGYNVSNFPMAKAHELINRVSQSIPDQAAAAAYVRHMRDMLD